MNVNGLVFKFYGKCEKEVLKDKTFDKLPPEAIRNAFQIFRYALKEFNRDYGNKITIAIINYGTSVDYCENDVIEHSVEKDIMSKAIDTSANSHTLDRTDQ